MDHRIIKFGIRIAFVYRSPIAGSGFRFFTPHSLPVRQAGAIPARPAGGPNPCPPGRRAQSGSTLIELVAVILITGILAAVVIPRVGLDTSSRASVEGAAHMIASDIRYTQECAMATRTSKTITFSVGGNSYSFTPLNNLDPSGRLPAGIATSALTLTFNSLGEPIAGGGGSVTVSGSGGAKTISVTNYTGKVSMN